MNYIEDELRLRIKTSIDNAKCPTGKPLDLNKGKSVQSFLRKQDYYDQLLVIFNDHPNFQSLTYLVRCIVNDTNLLSCDVCNKELTYTQSFCSSGNFGHHCSCKCAENDPILKAHIQNAVSSYYMENFGVTNCMQLSSTVQRVKETFIEHYGVDNNMKSERGMAEYKRTMNDKYGVDYTWELSSVQEKRKQSCLQHLSVEFPLQSEEIRQKTVETKYLKNNGQYFSDQSIQRRINSLMDRYGVDNYMKCEEGKLKVQKSMLEKYGVRAPAQNPEIHQKIKNTTFEHYGVYYPAQSYEIFQRIRRKYIYQSMLFDSKPELAFYIWLTENKITFEYQPNCNILYEYNGIQHRYFPDFKIGNQFYEIKGNHFLKCDGTWQCPYDHSKDALLEAKHQCCISNNVIIIYEDGYQKYLDYVSEKYGKTYLDSFKKT